MLRNETATSPERRAAALAGLRAYQDAPRGKTRKPAPARLRKGRARLRDYGAKGSRGRAVIVIPSLINPPFILDLVPETSLLRWLADQGFRPFLLDWGSPGPAERDMDVTAHVERLLLPLIAKFEEPPVLAGYCLGGTIALAAACAVPVAGLAMIAAPWHFAGFSDAARHDIAELWRSAQPVCEKMGLVPMEVLQAGFWRLDPARTIAKYESFGAMELGSAGARSFVAMEDWANAGAPLPYAAGRQMFDDFIHADLPGTGRWRVGGTIADPATLSCPAIDFVSLSDRIVPAASAADLPNRRDLGAGHVGMIVGRGARSQLWGPLADWLSGLPAPR
ncbi:MAG: poly-beta-hydroxybutyrate polymerase [Sphingomonas bacterium]|uniref:alpha/beta fold hydrolase n=1 Tax=Sphingomonas bacterium TaxID=1895847 RepID=UPI00262D07D7|nr:alpha/beta fold hydrolase [Sphingomonas bacterium]MDB5704583.1 poly-beta-hydroxybutyrate polymerase [Sphingomonas bacterium]